MHDHRSEDVRHGARFRARKGRVGNTHDLVQIIAQTKCAPDHLRILPKAMRPIIVRKHREGMCARRDIVAFSEHPPHDGPESKRAEHGTRNVL